MRNRQIPNFTHPPSWADIASPPSHSFSAHNRANVVPALTIELPEIILKRKVLTFSETKSIISNPLAAATSQSAAARALLKDIGTALPLCPQTGNVVPPPPSVVAIGIAPTTDPQIAFTSFSATQHALIADASLAKRSLPPHVVVPGVGKWSYMSYIYTLEAGFSRLLSILAHLRFIFQDLSINDTPLPTVVQTLTVSAAAGVAKRLSNEKLTLVRSVKSTTVSLRIRQALAIALSSPTNTINTNLSTLALARRVPPTFTDPPLHPAASPRLSTTLRHAPNYDSSTPRTDVPTPTRVHRKSPEPTQNPSLHPIGRHSAQYSALTSTTCPNRFAALSADNLRDNEPTRDQQPNIPFAATVVQQPMSLNDSSIGHNQQPSSISAPVTQHPTSSQHAGNSQDQQPISRPEGQLGETPPLTKDHAATTTEEPAPRTRPKHKHRTNFASPDSITCTNCSAQAAVARTTESQDSVPPADCFFARTHLLTARIPATRLLPSRSTETKTSLPHVPASSVETTLIGHHKRPLSPNAETMATQRSRLVDASPGSLDSPYRRISSPDPLETEHS